jgi:hypothetical protein
VTREDYDHINRIFTQGCSAVLQFDELSDSKLSAKERENKASSPKLLRLWTKESAKKTDIAICLPLHLWVCFLGAHFQHNSQGLIFETGKNPRLVLGGSTMYTPMDIVMNNMTPT